MNNSTQLVPKPQEDTDGDNRWLDIHKRFLQEW